MIVHIFPICEHRGIWSFRPQDGTSPVQVRVPKGSCLKPVKSVGLLLFVPGSDPLVCVGWPANQTMAEAQAGGRFKLVKAKGRERVTG